MADDTPAPVAQPLDDAWAALVTDIADQFGMRQWVTECIARHRPNIDAARAGPEYPMALVLHRHEYDLRCRLCGLAGQVRVSVEPEGEDPRD